MKGEFEKTVQHIKVRKQNQESFSVQVYHHYTQLWIVIFNIKDEVYYCCKCQTAICFWVCYMSGVWVSLGYEWCDCVDVCWLRWLKWMWFDFSLKLSTQSFRLNSSLRSFISFSEMKKKLQSLHWEMKRSRRSRWWRRSWRRWTDSSQLFHTQSKTRRRWWKPMTSAF